MVRDGGSTGPAYEASPPTTQSPGRPPGRPPGPPRQSAGTKRAGAVVDLHRLPRPGRTLVHVSHVRRTSHARRTSDPRRARGAARNGAATTSPAPRSAGTGDAGPSAYGFGMLLNVDGIGRE